jgi:hypothetical protein
LFRVNNVNYFFFANVVKQSAIKAEGSGTEEQTNASGDPEKSANHSCLPILPSNLFFLPMQKEEKIIFVPILPKSVHQIVQSPHSRANPHGRETVSL